MTIQTSFLPAAAAAAVMTVCTPLHAQEVYLRAGFPGAGVGYAQSISPAIAARAEFTTLGSRSMNGNREGVNFDGKLKADQAGVYGDWFPGAGGFRLTGGLSANSVKFSGTAVSSANGTVTINNTAIPFGPGDSYTVDVKYPSVTPYLGIGYGHHASNRGWGFVADLGVHLGKAKASSSVSPSVVAKLNAAGVNAQAEIDAQTSKVQDSLDKAAVLPVLSVGVSYRW